MDGIDEHADARTVAPAGAPAAIDGRWTGLESLAEAFAELGREVAAGAHHAADPGPGRAPVRIRGQAVPVLEAVVQVAVRRIAGADWCSVTTYRPAPAGARRATGTAEFVTVAATDERARKADLLQYDLGGGPCVDAIIHAPVYAPADIAHDERWPGYGRQVAADLGVGSMLSFRMAMETEDVIGGLNVYALRPHAFDEQDRLVGSMLAAYGAMAVTATTSQQRVDELEQGLRSSREIGTAMGVLMHRRKITRDEAFGLLQIASQTRNRKLRDVATEVADTGDLDLPDDPGRSAPGGRVAGQDPSGS